MTAPPDGILTTLRSPDWTIHTLASGWDAVALWWRYWPHADLSRGPWAYLVGPIDLSTVRVDDPRDPRVLVTGPAEWVYQGRTWEVAVPSSVSRPRDVPGRWDAARIVQIVTVIRGFGDGAKTSQGGHSHA